MNCYLSPYSQNGTKYLRNTCNTTQNKSWLYFPTLLFHLNTAQPWPQLLLGLQDAGTSCQFYFGSREKLNLLMPSSSPLCICAWRKWMKVGQTWRLLCIGENASISKLLRWNRQNHGTKQASDIFSLFFILFRSHFWKNQEFIRFSLQFSDVLYFLIGPGDCDVPFDEPRFGLCPFFGIFSISLLVLFSSGALLCSLHHISSLNFASWQEFLTLVKARKFIIFL